MRETKKVLEEQLKECRQEQDKLRQDNETLKNKLSFISRLMPNESMIIAVERITDALVRSMEVTNELSKRR